MRVQMPLVQMPVMETGPDGKVVLVFPKAKTNQSTQEDRKQQQTEAYGGLVLGGAVVLLWIGMVMAMNAAHNNLRPVFIALGTVITLGLGYAYYDTVHQSRLTEEEEAEREALQAPQPPQAPQLQQPQQPHQSQKYYEEELEKVKAAQSSKELLHYKQELLDAKRELLKRQQTYQQHEAERQVKVRELNIRQNERRSCWYCLRNTPKSVFDSHPQA